MKNFPKWAEELLQPDEPGPRPHVLNLALTLRDPTKLPLMLLDVATAQPAIQRALKDLAFLHYARFVPSYDGEALMVITEFDGPLKPYVMDFVIALGDLFNQLLSYVEFPPLLPIQQHPDSFWEFVEKWNRVPFLPRTGNKTDTVFPASFDYPVYAAYPGKSVIDIVGARDAELHGLRPTLDRQATQVKLADVQGNILRGYHALSVRHLMLKVSQAAQARSWLAQQAVQDAQDWGPTPPAHGLLNVAFSFDGLKALLPARSNDLDQFPQAFREGPARRAKDNGDRDTRVPGKPDQPSSAPDSWRFGGPQHGSVHVLLSLHRLANMTPAAFEQQYAALKQQAQLNGLALVHEESAEALPGDRMYFDFRDGITEPRIAGQCPIRGERPSMEPASSPGEFLLGKGYQSIYKGASLGEHMPSDLADNGCYGALRLIEQDEAAFNQLKADLVARFGGTQEDAAARLLGRWHDGQPLSLYGTNPGPPPAGTPPRNDFDYTFNWEYPGELDDHVGARCPLDAHIRRANPRSHHAAGMRHTRRLLRRGMPAKWISADGKPRVGLMGLFLCADLERQFEFIQREWIQGGESGHSDAIAGVRSGTTPFRWAPGEKVDIPPLVFTRGSLYLFYPGMTMLKRLPTLNQSPAPAPSPKPWKQLEDLVEQLTQRLKDLHLPAPAVEFVVGQLLPYVEHSQTLERFAKALSPPPPPDLSQVPPAQQIKVGALRTAFIADPCEESYRKLRRLGPTFFWEGDHQAFWALNRTEVSRIVAKADEFVQAPSTTLLRGIITLDGDDHEKVRAAFAESMEAPLHQVSANLDAALNAQLNQLSGLGQFDFVRDLSNPVLSRVFWQLLGLSEDRRAACSRHAAMAMRQFSQPVPRRAAAQAAGANASARLFAHLALELGLAMVRGLWPFGDNPYEGTLLGGIAARTKLFPGLPEALSQAVDEAVVPDLVKPVLPGLPKIGLPQLPKLPKLPALPEVAAPLGPARTLDFLTAVTSLLQFVLAGHLAPQLLVGSATRSFLKHDAAPGKSVWGHLAAQPPATREAPLKTALEEARRFDPPVTIIQRYTKGVVDIGGLRLQPDTPVFAVIASANRDGPPEQNLNAFEWDRKPLLPHFSLGDGPHVCIGAQLQAAMVPRMLSTLMTRFPGLRLVDPQAVPAWIDNVYFRGLESLPVTT